MIRQQRNTFLSVAFAVGNIRISSGCFVLCGSTANSFPPASKVSIMRPIILRFSILRFSILRIFALVFLTAFLAQPLEAQQAARSFESIGDVVSQWTEDQHLYVRGSVGISDDQLSKLETWLDENGKHWTVVLMDTAVGQSYQSPDRRLFNGCLLYTSDAADE